MDEIKNIQDIASDTVRHVHESPEWGENWDSLKYIADYYRLRVDNNKEVFSSDLPSYVEQYNTLNIHEDIVRMPNEEIPNFIVKEIVGYYREWAFLYGFRNKNTDNHQIDTSQYSGEKNRTVLQRMNRRIVTDGANAQEVFVGLKLAHEAFENDETEVFDTPEEYLSIASDVSSHIERYLQTARESTEAEFDWNHLGSSFDFTYKELHNRGLKKSAKAELAQRISEGRISAEEYLNK